MKDRIENENGLPRYRTYISHVPRCSCEVFQVVDNDGLDI